MFKDTTLETLVGKQKFFYGDPTLFPVITTGVPAMTFNYTRQSNQVSEVGCSYGIEHDNDYFMEEFLQQQQIMAVFPWDEHTYYHTFEPMLPPY